MEKMDTGDQAGETVDKHLVDGAQAMEDLLDYEPAEENPDMYECSVNGAQAIEDTDLLDNEPEEEELSNYIQKINLSGGQAKKFSKIRNGVPKCGICSDQILLGYETLDIHHNHFSNVQKDSVLDDPTTGRIKICLTDSSLHEQWETLMACQD